ncbi:NACHT domain-containing protein [Actinomadura alba]|uniref:NACHT domain-containing protein n=1 Tax=Actinomadura alba TaxID=406431 RepID=A0ABR7LR54_9ACTN|nr:NACHT domain-containing protein [Actinomadura alba]MBC6467315.1 NACHT domain-containing protein [Actinomadura alba]
MAVGFGSIVSTLGGLIALFNGSMLLLGWWRKATGPLGASTTTEISTAKDILAGLVTEQWKEETVLRSLGDPEPIPVPWRSTEHEELMDHPRLIAEGAVAFPSLSGHITAMVNDFRTLRCRRLVILGGPGVGKTTLAVQLLMELLRTRRPGEPVPVLLSAARWDTKARPQLRDWLAECLRMDYPALRAEGMPPDTPRTLAYRGEVLPVLDGLDELSDETRADILAALNRSMSGDDQLILTCRTAQFAESVNVVGDVLTAAAVIEPRPLSPGAAADYLQACLPPRPPATWSHVLDALRDGSAPALLEVTSTALGLWLVRIAYVASRVDPKPLLNLGHGDPSDLRDHLCDRLIPELVKSRPPADDPVQPFRPYHSWEPDQVHRWLTYLARQLAVTGADTHGMAWWHLARYTPTRSIRLTVSLGYGLLAGLTFGALTVPVVGAVVGLLSALVLMLTTGSWFTQTPGYVDLRLRGKRPLVLRTIIETLIIGLLGAFVGWRIGESGLYAMQIGLLTGLVFVFMLGVPRFEHPTTATTARSPRATWRADRNLTLVQVVIGIAIGIMAVILLWNVGISLIGAFAGGLLLGLLIELIKGRHHAWLAYSLTVPRLASKGVLPLRAMGFLEDAHRLGLLRTEGPFYQFRNIELQKHLSDQKHFSGSVSGR